MKKASRKSADELRPEYKRSDFTSLVRGKYAARVAQATNVVVLEPKVAHASRMIARSTRLCEDCCAPRKNLPAQPLVRPERAATGKPADKRVRLASVL